MPEQRLDPSQYFIAAALGYRAPVAGFARLQGKLPRYFLNADQQHGQLRVCFSNFRSGLQSGHDRHAKIHDHDIGFELLDFFNRLRTIATS